MAERHAARELVAFAGALLGRAGLDDDKAGVTAELLVEADLMGHSTHGLQLLAAYLAAIEAGSMATAGLPEIVADRGAACVWDGRRLPGLWLTARALDQAVERAGRLGLASVAIRNSHHIGCLAVFLERATSQDMMAIVASSDPSVSSVAPYGGTRGLYTPDPIAVGIPTDGLPILIDMSASITTNGLAGRLHQEGRRLPGPWVMDADGHVGDDPAVLFTNPPGTILPTGGRDHGHKGYGLALMIEALTQGLSGFGRAEAPGEWGASVYVQALDPELFAGAAAFTRETSWLADACRANPPAPGVDRVRLPGEAALARKAHALADGVALYPGIMQALLPLAERWGVAVPTPLGE